MPCENVCIIYTRIYQKATIAYKGTTLLTKTAVTYDNLVVLIVIECVLTLLG